MQGGVRSISDTRAVIRSRVFPPTLWTWFTDDDGEKKQTSRRGLGVTPAPTSCTQPYTHVPTPPQKKHARTNFIHTYTHRRKTAPTWHPHPATFPPRPGTSSWSSSSTRTRTTRRRRSRRIAPLRTTRCPLPASRKVRLRTPGKDLAPPRRSG